MLFTNRFKGYDSLPWFNFELPTAWTVNHTCCMYTVLPMEKGLHVGVFNETKFHISNTVAG